MLQMGEFIFEIFLRSSFALEANDSPLPEFETDEEHSYFISLKRFFHSPITELICNFYKKVRLYDGFPYFA